MFTGIVQAVGHIVATEQRDGDLRLQVRAPQMAWDDVAVGDSIATNGVCLTAVALTGDGFRADVSLETVNLTTVGGWHIGHRINMEKSLTPASPLGGHIVSGHVDGVGEVIDRRTDARSERFRLRAPVSLARYIARKGSITVDGISLTVNAVDGAEFELNIVPHTLSHTICGDYQPGTRVNLEVDVIARYLERLLLDEKAADPGAGELNAAFLAKHGYLRD